ncbi:D-2-hydroxyacid dehydrogenase [Saprospiraceae bacterium]|nr:D-2-hydroxyacid dehydrogenase [Saprospiraceae bacterium]
MNIVVLDGQTLNPGDNPWQEVEELGELTVYAKTEPKDVVKRSAAAGIIVTNKVVIDAAVLDQLPALRFIAVTATGYNVVDVAAANRKGMLVSNVPVYGTDSVAQHVFASLLSFIHRPELHHAAIQAGEWEASGNFSFWKSSVVELAGKTMGIVGFGRIGKATARLAAAFGMKVVVTLRSAAGLSQFDEVEVLGVEELFAVSDFISLHCPQTESNVGFVNRELIDRMKQSSVLINTARGGLINEHDLAEALSSRRIAGAILDVVSEEPMTVDNPLFSAPNCLLTPHMAWTALEARRRLMHVTAENIAAFLDGNPINVIPTEVCG